MAHLLLEVAVCRCKKNLSLVFCERIGSGLFRPDSVESPSSFFSPALLPGSPVGSSSVKPWGETEKRTWNAPSRRASSVPGNDIQRTLSPPWFPLVGGPGVSGAIANTRIFLFLKEALQWIIHTIISAKLCWSLSCRCSVSQSTFPGHSPPIFTT